MSQTDHIKPDRIQIRVDAHTKKKLERAAFHQHQTLSEFMTHHALTAAERVLAEQEKITLSDADWTQFYNALVNPPEPNEALRSAMSDYLEQRKG
jgi:uncharacterized protein (DUF1778 family)